MENLLNVKAAPFESTGSGASSSGINLGIQMQSVDRLIQDLYDSRLRENALLELSKRRDQFKDLAPLLWKSFGVVAVLLQVFSISAPGLTTNFLNGPHWLCGFVIVVFLWELQTLFIFLWYVWLGLTWLLIVAVYGLTSGHKVVVPHRYPFLYTTSKERPFEYLRLTSLGVIGALVKADETETISFLLSTEIIPLCLHSMEIGSEFSKTVETFTVQRILHDDVGLVYICTTAERFFAVGRVLANMVALLAEQPYPRHLKHIIMCYLRLSENARACDALRTCLPAMLRAQHLEAAFVKIQPRVGAYSN